MYSLTIYSLRSNDIIRTQCSLLSRGVQIWAENGIWSRLPFQADHHGRQVLMSIPHEATVALVKMTMEYLIASGWQAPGIEEPLDPSNIADALYMKLSLKPSRD